MLTPFAVFGIRFQMCRRIHKDLKKQSALGLPEGWTFASGIGPNVTLISPTGDEFDSFQDALDRCSVAIDNIDEAMFEFETFLDGSIPWNDYSHFLVGLFGWVPMRDQSLLRQRAASRTNSPTNLVSY